ncbi:MAG: hypothetical protein ACRC2T_14380, partial [Thermoguttaceae bacterium]
DTFQDEPEEDQELEFDDDLLGRALSVLGEHGTEENESGVEENEEAEADPNTNDTNDEAENTETADTVNENAEKDILESAGDEIENTLHKTGSELDETLADEPFDELDEKELIDILETIDKAEPSEETADSEPEDVEEIKPEEQEAGQNIIPEAKPKSEPEFQSDTKSETADEQHHESAAATAEEKQDEEIREGLEVAIFPEYVETITTFEPSETAFDSTVSQINDVIDTTANADEDMILSAETDYPADFSEFIQSSDTIVPPRKKKKQTN